MTQYRKDMIRELLISLGIMGHVACKLNQFGDRLVIWVNGEYYGIWDIPRKTWVD